ncbi:MAG: OmpW family protein [Gammaproteobacteria bacterium]|nr:OmpW family protein [Gammaproteobacteria bacterium]
MRIVTMRGALALLGIATLALEPVPALAETGDWLVRARGIAIVTDDSSGPIHLEAGGISTPLDGSGVGVDTNFVPELDVTYMVTDNIGIEAIAGIAIHDVDLEGPGPLLSSLGFTDGFKIFDSWVLPPTVTVQYHFMPENNIRPYVGVGVNYTAFLWNDATDKLEAAVGPVDVDMDNGFTWAAQIGADVDINDKWYFNVDVKYIDIDSTASLLIKNGAFANTGLRVNVDINPWVVGAGIGLRF